MRRTAAFKGVGHAEIGPKPLLDQSSERMSAPISPPDGNSCSMLMAELHVFVCVIGPLQRPNGWMQMGHRREDLHRTRT